MSWDVMLMFVAIIRGEKSPHWYKLLNKEVVLVDTVWKGDVRMIAIDGDSFD
jgi:hypothetical protein